MIATSIPEIRRILLVAEDDFVYEDFKKTLATQVSRNSEYLDLAVASCLMNDVRTERPAATSSYDIDWARTSSDAIKRAVSAKETGIPFAVAFINTSMLGEWGGIQTAKSLWHDCPDLHIALCVESLECSTGEIIEQLGLVDKLLLLKKPLDNAEVSLAAATLAEKWQVSRSAHLLLKRQSEYIVDSSSVLGLFQANQSLLENIGDDLQAKAQEVHLALTGHIADLDATQDITEHTLAELAESRCSETGEHLEHLRSYSQIIAEELARRGRYTDQINERFLSDLYRAAPMHDIGKVGIPESILMKPGPLTPGEFEDMKRHTVIGAQALLHAAGLSRGGSFLNMAATVALSHHERYNGLGYPQGLAGDDIPLCARIVAIADVFDALVSERVYKAAIDLNKAYGIIVSERGEHFDPFVCDAFEACFDRIQELKKSIDQCFKLGVGGKGKTAFQSPAMLEDPIPMSM